MLSDYNKEKFLLIGNLTPNLIHDIRNSLSVLKLNYYYLSLKEDSIPAEIASSLKDCSEAINRLEKKLDYFSLLISNNAGSKEVCSLNTIATAVLDLLKGKAKKTNIALENLSSQSISTLKINKSKISIAVAGIINSLLDTGISNQKIILKVSTDSSNHINLEIDKQEKENCDTQILDQECVKSFLKNLETTKENLKEDNGSILFEGDIKGNCKINFSFNKQ